MECTLFPLQEVEHEVNRRPHAQISTIVRLLNFKHNFKHNFFFFYQVCDNLLSGKLLLNNFNRQYTLRLIENIMSL